MSRPSRTATAALVIGPDRDRTAVVARLGEQLAPAILLEAGRLDDLPAVLGASPSVEIALVLLVADAGTDRDIDHELELLATHPQTARARRLLVTARMQHHDLSSAFDLDRLHGIVGLDDDALGRDARVQLDRWGTAGDQAPTSDEARESTPTGQPTSAMLADLELDEAAVTARLLEAIDAALGPRPVLHLEAGTRLTHQGYDVDAVVIVRRGSVALDRDTAAGQLRLHHSTTGPVVGLLSLAQRRQAYFTARATTAVEVVHLTVEQLDRALAREPEVGAALATVAIRALAGRLRRSEQLQIERTRLSQELETERRQLADALSALEGARLDLVEQARWATLGELAAGIAHELNNPVAALTRSLTYVVEDVDALLADHPRAALVRERLRAAAEPAPTTAEERAARQALTEAVGDRRLAERLVRAGIRDPAAARELAADPATLDTVEHASRLGATLRNLDVAGTRISELVDSLRSYARPQAEPLDGLDVHETVEDALRLLSHRLGGVTVERAYGRLPPIRGHPGPLSQVWTNLVSNALEALEGQGRIVLTTDAPDDEHVRVRVTDDGPGIDPELLPRLFEPRFTTRRGTVRYGLGLGLAIARRIVGGHGGTIEVDTRPGETTFEVVLPVAGPPDETLQP
jgi:two-component system, NtrC family, sensor kinase